VLNDKQISMTKLPNSKQYDLEDRTYRFARRCRNFVNGLPRTLTNIEYGKQLTRSSGSQAANYIEANESLSKKDFVHRTKICRKEAKESRLWLRLCEVGNDDKLKKNQKKLIQEALELTKIFNSIVSKCK
jgi:four helix bundle protein